MSQTLKLDETVRVRLPRNLKRELRRLAIARVKTPSELVREVVVQYIRSNETKKEN